MLFLILLFAIVTSSPFIGWLDSSSHSTSIHNSIRSRVAVDTAPPAGLAQAITTLVARQARLVRIHLSGPVPAILLFRLPTLSSIS